MRTQRNPTTNDDQVQDFSSVREAIDRAKEKTASRIVRLNYQSCCGCGCYDEPITREVPFDSDLQDGDDVYEMLDSDMSGWGDWEPEDDDDY